MQIKTNIVKAVEEVDKKARYDTEIKKILSDPQILAWILKYTVREFEDYSIPDIMSCIEGKPEVATHPVRSGNYTLPVEGMPTESAEVAAQKVTYDIRFRVAVPEEKIETMKNEFNIVTTVELEGGLAKMCNLSDYIEEKGIEKGIEKGLIALIDSLTCFISDSEELYQAVIKNEVYKDIPREEVFKYLNRA